jgi:signal transduction histidine kinase/CheY-like chemotaxis protein
LITNDDGASSDNALELRRRDPERVAALRRTGLLDTDVEDVFDRLTRLAVQLLGVPAAFISLVDANRDFYKSACGFGEPLASARELTGLTFCHYTVAQNTPLVIPDTAADPLYRGVPTVCTLGVAAYVGVPLVIEGQAIGAFCTIDTRPRNWTADEVRVLVELAASAQREIELRGAVATAHTAVSALEVQREQLERANDQLHEQAIEQGRLAFELQQAQKMEAVGQLAGGIAHDFNNLLTVIGAHSTFLLNELPPLHPGRDDAQAIQQSANRAATLTRDLLAFSRRQILRPMVTDLNSVAAETQRFVARVLPEDVTVALHLDPEVPAVLVDASQLQQVLVNLVVNSRDAMPEGGSVTIGTRSESVERAVGNGVPPGRYSVLSVADTGIGMDDATRAHIFEPFFTTKEVGKGSGLGLSTVYGIVKQSGGHILVASALGQGATFDIYLPVTDEGLAAPEEVQAGGESSKAMATILLVEDDPAVRRIEMRVLTGEGFRVLEARDGQTAIDVANRYEGRIDLVISDAVLPGMNGAAALRQIRAARPECRGMLVSGYTEDEMARRGIWDAGLAFLQKPFTAADLALRVRRTLLG